MNEYYSTESLFVSQQAKHFVGFLLLFPIKKVRTYAFFHSPRCLSILSSPNSFIFLAFSNAIATSCQFANLLLFYILCDLINSCSNLYQLKPNELEEAILDKKAKYWEIDFDSLNLKDSVKAAMKALGPKKRNEPKKKVNISASSEVDFIQSLLCSVSFNKHFNLL